MKNVICLAAIGLATGMLAVSSWAQSNPSSEGGPSAPAQSKHPHERDCSKAPNPERCAKRQAAFAACKDKAAGPDRRACLREQLGDGAPEER